MSDHILEQSDNSYTYRVYYDEYPVIGLDFDYGNKEDNEAYYQKFLDDVLTNFYVEKMKKCGCCDQLQTIDCLCGIHDETPEQAIQYYIDYYS